MGDYSLFSALGPGLDLGRRSTETATLRATCAPSHVQLPSSRGTSHDSRGSARRANGFE
jgi:hypothetical protein